MKTNNISSEQLGQIFTKEFESDFVTYLTHEQLKEEELANRLSFFDYQFNESHYTGLGFKFGYETIIIIKNSDVFFNDKLDK